MPPLCQQGHDLQAKVCRRQEMDPAGTLTTRRPGSGKGVTPG